jgi:hypothetical protein
VRSVVDVSSMWRRFCGRFLPIRVQDSGGKLNTVDFALFLPKKSVLARAQLHRGIGDQVPAGMVGVVVNFALDAWLQVGIMELAAGRTCDLYRVLESAGNERQAVICFLLVLES